MTTDEVKKLKVAHVACKIDFVFFIRYFFKSQYKRKWNQWEHLILICEELKKVIEGVTLRLIINCAPRYGKTDVSVKFFIAYGLAINPAAKFIHVTYSDDLALDNSEAARDIVSSEEYQKLFPYVKLKPSSKGKKKWYTEQGGGVYAVSFGGQITGFGAGQVDKEENEYDPVFDDKDLDEFIEGINNASDIDWLGNKVFFGGAILIDDANKVDDADSETLRTRVNDRFDSTISNRVNSRKTPIINGQQRTHEQDLSGYLIKKQGRIEDGGEWNVLSLPSIKEDGTALCPDKHTIEELKKLEHNNDIVFQRQHMQNPKPKAGLLFPIDDLHFYDPVDINLNDPDFKYLAADPAADGGDSFSGIDSRLIGNKIYIPNILFNTDGTDHNEIALIDMIISAKIMYAGIEGVFGWAQVVQRVREDLERKGHEGELRLLRPRTGKHARITTAASFIRNNFYFRKDWEDFPQYAKFMRNLTSYLRIQEPGRKNKHDDAPDNCHMIADYYQKEMGHLWPVGVNNG